MVSATWGWNAEIATVEIDENNQIQELRSQCVSFHSA
jgi:hypothetical protein